MKIHQWEVWKTRPPGFEADHWFVKQIKSTLKAVLRF